MIQIAQRDLVKEETSDIEVKIDVTYNATAAPVHAAQVVNKFSEIVPDMVIESYTHRQGG